MNKRTSSPELAQRIQKLEKAIKANERRQRRLQRAIVSGRVRNSEERPPNARYSRPLPERQVIDDRPVKFNHENAPIFMSGSLEALDAKHISPTERRNRFLLLLFFATAVLIGIIYMLWQ